MHLDTERLSVRELRTDDIPLIADYWEHSDLEYLISIGVDPEKITPRKTFISTLSRQLSLPKEERNAYCIIWLLDGIPIGHCNTNPTQFGNDAYLHLHIWKPELRNKGLGLAFLKKTIPLLFENLQLNVLYSQPNAANKAANRTLEKLGFDFVDELETLPGSITSRQMVKKWELDKDYFMHMINA